MVDTATALDDHTLELRLSSPAPQLPAAIVDIKMTDVDDIANVNENANGTGPFKLSAFVPDQEVTVVAQRRLLRRRRRNSTRSSSSEVQRHDVGPVRAHRRTARHDVERPLRPDRVADVPQASPWSARMTPTQAAVFQMDNSSAPFNDVRARQALSFATDRAAIQAAAYGGTGVLNTGSTLISPKSPFSTDDVTEYTYDLDTAKALFAEAGVTEGDQLTCWAPAGAYPEFLTACQILQRSLDEIGIVLEIETNETSTWAEKFYPAGQSVSRHHRARPCVARGSAPSLRHQLLRRRRAGARATGPAALSSRRPRSSSRPVPMNPFCAMRSPRRRSSCRRSSPSSRS